MYFLIFKVKIITELGIDQSKGALTMTVLGCFELLGRVLMACLGDRIKGRILYFYVAFCFGLSLLNLTATKASTLPHMITYAMRK